MQRIILYITTLIALTGCFKDVSYDTTLVLRPTQVIVSGGSAIGLPGVVAYAFAADTLSYEVTSYENALAGIMNDKESGDQIVAFAKSTPYMNDVYGFMNAIALDVDINRDVIAIVVIDTLNGDYGYTTYELGVNIPTTYVALNFAPWKEGKFEYGEWCFVVETPYEPEIPDVEFPDIVIPDEDIPDEDTPEVDTPDEDTPEVDTPDEDTDQTESDNSEIVEN